RRRQRIEVDRLPLFVTGLHPQVARWRMEFAFAQKALPSVFGRPLPAGYRFRNTFAQGVGGRMHIVTPSAWDVEGTDVSFKLAPGEQRDDQFTALLGLDASSGPQPIRVDFEVIADRSYHFSVFSNQNVGLGDVEL